MNGDYYHDVEAASNLNSLNSVHPTNYHQGRLFITLPASQLSISTTPAENRTSSVAVSNNSTNTLVTTTPNPTQDLTVATTHCPLTTTIHSNLLPPLSSHQQVQSSSSDENRTPQTTAQPPHSYQLSERGQPHTSSSILVNNTNQQIWGRHTCIYLTSQVYA